MKPDLSAVNNIRDIGGLSHKQAADFLRFTEITPDRFMGEPIPIPCVCDNIQIRSH